jgi:hypothetical protein
MTTELNIDLSQKSKHWLLWYRERWLKQFGKWIVMDATLLAAIAEIDAELDRRGVAHPPALVTGK